MMHAFTSYWIGFGDGARGQHGEDCIHGLGSREAYLDFFLNLRVFIKE